MPNFKFLDMKVCDEAVAALDVSIRAQILNLFKKLDYDLFANIYNNMTVIRHLKQKCLTTRWTVCPAGYHKKDVTDYFRN